MDGRKITLSKDKGLGTGTERDGILQESITRTLYLCASEQTEARRTQCRLQALKSPS